MSAERASYAHGRQLCVRNGFVVSPHCCYNTAGKIGTRVKLEREGPTSDTVLILFATNLEEVRRYCQFVAKIYVRRHPLPMLSTMIILLGQHRVE